MAYVPIIARTERTGNLSNQDYNFIKTGTVLLANEMIICASSFQFVFQRIVLILGGFEA